MNYTWTFSNFEIKPNYNGMTNVVSVIHWRLTAIDNDGTTASNYGTAKLSEPHPSQYIEFNDITEEMAIAWVSSIVDVDSLKANLASQVEFIRNPPSIFVSPPFSQ